MYFLRFRACLPLLAALMMVLSVGVTLPVLSAEKAPSPEQGLLQPGVIKHHGKKRTYYLYIPTSYQQGQKMPLVMAFHGYLGSARQMMRMTSFNTIADQEGFLVLYPDARDKWRTRSGPSDMSDEDVTFVEKMLTEIEHTRTVDASRVYALGFSNGGFFTQRLACELSNRIAAFATVASTIGEPLMESCQPSRPVPILMINGTDDPVVTWEGQFKKVRYAFRDSVIATVPEMTAFWSKKNRCNEVPRVKLIVHASPGHNGAQINMYPDCAEPSNVEQVIIPHGGHTWPGWEPKYKVAKLILGEVTKDINASQVMWEFFESHPMPGEMR